MQHRVSKNTEDLGPGVIQKTGFSVS